jgi:hypothetical protein
MADSTPIRRKGTTHYDLLGMGDEEFERMNGRLIRLEFPRALKPANTRDGGADMALPRSGGGYERCWQSKHFPRGIHWASCERSLRDALVNWTGITEYTFVFPRELTANEQKTFDRKFRGPDAEIEVNYWNGEELQARLTESDAGRRVARTFFQEVELDVERLNRAIEVGGRLDAARDALDRLGNIGGFLASSDAFFSYPAATHEADGAGPPPTPGSVMSIGETSEAVTRRIDVVPRDAEAMERYGPQFVLSAAEGEAGARAAAKLAAALREGTGVEIDEGLDLTFTRLPPALDDMVGRRLTGGIVQLVEPRQARRRASDFRARLTAESDLGRASLDVAVQQAEDVPDGWDDALVGHSGGMTVTMLTRRIDGGGEIRWNFQHRRNASPARSQLAALRFLRVLSGGGHFVFARSDVGGEGLRTETTAVPLDQQAGALIAFLEKIRTIEEWAGVEYELPEVLDEKVVQSVTRVALIIAAGGQPVTWHEFEFIVDDAQLPPLQEGRGLRIERAAQAAIFGRTIPLGYLRLDLTSYVLASVATVAEQPGKSVVRIEPRAPESAQAFEALVRDAMLARPASRRPPPPPPRKRRRKKHGGRRKHKR